MKKLIREHHRLFFFGCWIILALIQAGFTELLDDEAYYWVYSKYLDWGYFDHPPMIAVLIRIGYSIFHNELGVRLLLVVLNLVSLLIIEKMTVKKDPRLFYTIALSLVVLQLAGFVAVPDTPLIFFTALFFLCYRRFLERSGLLNTFLLGLVVAALLYSKYHAVLIVFFVVLSNLKLLTRYQIYLAGLVALVFFTPHLWWQYQHDWISFRYHLFESNVNAYKASFTIEYIFGQILLAGPLAGVILLPAAFAYRTKNEFEKGLKFTLIGVYAFFLLSSFRGRVEGNWTSPSIVPLMILSHAFISEGANKFSNTARKWLMRLLPITIVLVFFARAAMIIDILPVKEIKRRYHGWNDWPEAMKKTTQGLPVVFENSYQRASKYWFYTGQFSYSLNYYRERKNNYNFWPIEDSLLGKPVYLLDIHNLDSFQLKMPTAIGDVAYKFDPVFSSFAKVKFIPAQTTIHIPTGPPQLQLKLHAEMPALYRKYILSHDLNTEIVIGLFDKKGWIDDIPVAQTLKEIIQGEQTWNYQLNLPKGNYYLIISIFHVGTITATHNSDKIKLIVD